VRPSRSNVPPASVDRLLPLHGRIVPLADLNRAIGRSN